MFRAVIQKNKAGLSDLVKNSSLITPALLTPVLITPRDPKNAIKCRRKKGQQGST